MTFYFHSRFPRYARLDFVRARPGMADQSRGNGPVLV